MNGVEVVDLSDALNLGEEAHHRRQLPPRCPDLGDDSRVTVAHNILLTYEDRMATLTLRLDDETRDDVETLAAAAE